MIGYLHQKELSEKKFIPNPFIKKEGALIYGTGDVAKHNSDGNIYVNKD